MVIAYTIKQGNYIREQLKKHAYVNNHAICYLMSLQGLRLTDKKDCLMCQMVSRFASFCGVHTNTISFEILWLFTVLPRPPVFYAYFRWWMNAHSHLKMSTYYRFYSCCNFKPITNTIGCKRWYIICSELYKHSKWNT